jgi:putative two-component system protein, hydrogenase maturation factor HypX/HoxX
MPARPPTDLRVKKDSIVRVLLLASAFNGLTQRLHRELSTRGHTVSVELAISPQAMEEAVTLFRPDIILCPFLKQRVPDSIWKQHTCLIVHPGIEGDRGPSSLDWAIKGGAAEWGVTLLEAAEEMDAGRIWGTATFPMREVSKGGLYRREVTEQTVRLVLAALEQHTDHRFRPRALNYDDPNVRGRWNRAVRQEDRAIDWRNDSTKSIVREINAADGAPGVLDEVAGTPVYLYGARAAIGLRGRPGELIAKCHGAICRGTIDGAVWISHLKVAAARPAVGAIKLPATSVIERAADALPHLETDVIDAAQIGCNEIRYYERGAVGYLHFDFYNGAMNSAQCRRLKQMLAQVKRRPTKVIALLGGEEFWSNGIHLNCIEAATSPADESWANINAMNDLVEEIIRTDRQLTVAVLRTNAGAGGAVMAAACDHVWIRSGVVLNVHYQTMGLYGSEYWTYVLPRRVGSENARCLTQECMPTLASEAQRMGLADLMLPEQWSDCQDEVDRWCIELSEGVSCEKALAAKAMARERDEQHKPLQAYRDEELRHMYRTFYDPGSSYHEARRDFVYKRTAEATPLRIAAHRRSLIRRRA